MMSVTEAAKAFGISRAKIYELTRTPGFPTITLGRRRLIPVKALEEWLTSQIGL
jgi:excisionase family DNA binding protein